MRILPGAIFGPLIHAFASHESSCFLLTNHCQCFKILFKKQIVPKCLNKWHMNLMCVEMVVPHTWQWKGGNGQI